MTTMVEMSAAPHSGRKIVTAVLGTYRKGGATDTAVDEILAAAEAAGAETAKIYLIDRQIAFCTNCRTCTQSEGIAPGHCPIKDEFNAILEQLGRSDAIVLASPMNCWTVTAVMKRFMERLVCFAYWPWGTAAPKIRNQRKTKRAVIVASSATPAIIARLTTRMVGLMKSCAGLLGAKTIGVLWIGMAAGEPKPDIDDHIRKKARSLGKKLAS